MIEIIVHVECPIGNAAECKESVAMELERFGDVRVVSVREIGAEQMRINTKGRSA